MRKSTILAAVAAILMSTAGAAADGGAVPDTPPPPPPETGGAEDGGYTTPPPPAAPERYDWSGVYAGVQGGWLWGEDEAFEIQIVEMGIPPSEVEVYSDGPLPYDTDGYAVGGVLGVNLQTGRWVYGIELDVEYADLSGQWNWGNGNGLNKNIDIMGSVRPRVGFALDRILVYGTGGIALGYAHMEAFDGPPPLFTIDGDETTFGYTYGGGVEVAVSEHWSAGAEYRYTDLGESQHRDEIFNGDFKYTHTNRFHAVRARLIYRMPI